MQIGSVQNQYINHYHQEGMQVANQNAAETRAIENLTAYQQAEYRRQQERQQYQWMAYIMMMQFFAKQGMWNMIDQMRVQKTLDIRA